MSFLFYFILFYFYFLLFFLFGDVAFSEDVSDFSSYGNEYVVRSFFPDGVFKNK